MCQDIFSSLSTEILLNIFRYFDANSLCNLRLTCHRFKNLIDSFQRLLIKNYHEILSTNQENEQFSKRCRRKLKPLEKIRLNKNWRHGIYRECELMTVSARNKTFIPWLQMSNNHLWFSRADKIHQFKRTNKRLDRSNVITNDRGREDVTRFRVKNDSLVVGKRDGSMFLWSLDRRKVVYESFGCHNSDINCVDICKNNRVVVSGSRDNSFKVWDISQCFFDEIFCDNLGDTVWTVGMSDLNKKIAVGTSWNKLNASLLIYDVERLSEKEQYNQNSTCSGVLDVKFGGYHDVWSCGYDGFLRRWDMRTGNCEQSMEDPCADALYCFDLDYFNTALTGAKMHSRVNLWDIRQGKCVQMYFLRKRKSPVYSVAFDSENLYVAADKSLNILDFNSKETEPKCYKYFLNYKCSSY